MLEDSDQNLFGGYLLLSLAGRPLEFHCTTPIRPNRAQRILYGPTLEPFLFGELIGGTLYRKATTVPGVVCTDVFAAVCLREHVDVPVVLVLPSEEMEPSGDARPVPRSEGPSAAAAAVLRVDAPHAPRPPLVEFCWRANRLAVPARGGGERDLILEQLAGAEELLDLAEPFERIRQAIDEARGGGR